MRSSDSGWVCNLGLFAIFITESEVKTLAKTQSTIFGRRKSRHQSRNNKTATNENGKYEKLKMPNTNGLVRFEKNGGNATAMKNAAAAAAADRCCCILRALTETCEGCQTYRHHRSALCGACAERAVQCALVWRGLTYKNLRDTAVCTDRTCVSADSNNNNSSSGKHYYTSNAAAAPCQPCIAYGRTPLSSFAAASR